MDVLHLEGGKKIMIFYDTQQAIQYLSAFQGKKIGTTSGCWDLLHPLHVLTLQKCSRECDVLFVQVDSDMLSLRNKNKIPHINELDRAYMVDSLKFVDCSMVINSLQDIYDLLTGLERMNNFTDNPNTLLHFKNSTSIYGTPTLEVPGVDLIVIPDVQRFTSTTQIIQHLKQQ